MAHRNYVTTLVKLLRRICQYIVRYQVALTAGLTAWGVSDASTKVAALMAACEAITLDVDIPVNP